ncbi:MULTISPECIES: LacI family DNA-binding transcriptional regulator [Rahnella]|uniref:LacI family DNA-binding transcriptional regulator n=1 Tax=Rahnella TaxID=34037 RepID=UPI000701EEAC|nr:MULTISPECIES: LacI family DNA-binding transcriptional regulator [Rahnella]KQN67961.1 lac repressor [Serratia sp. Leaf51]MBB6114616.1 DNA-binding LacI/PurR family transcriptional regulator [Rahnella inusitata]MBU9831057.1 LacI family DNA-binding transcriptional regulator [Rahnella rivi]THD41573.1 LacI family DNA-binding transcriptional regulator [Enterobacteriaceae bacterium ML5]
MKSKSSTLEDVARYAGVSYQTVSRVLNKSANVSEATRLKVEQAIDVLRYVPNRLAQQLVGKQSFTLGLVTTSLALHAPSQIAASVKKYAHQAGYQVLISMIDEDVNQSIQDSINELKSQRVDRVIINIPLESAEAEHIYENNRDILCLFLDVDPGSPVFNVCFNPADGSRASVEYLLELGHRDFALLAGPEESVSSRLRLQSWQDTLREKGLAPVTVIHGDWSAKSGYYNALHILRETPQFTAMLVGNDQMALGVISALHQHNVAIPEQVSIIGYDDTYDSAFFHPALTTVSLDLDLQSKEAVERLLATKNDVTESTLLPAKLVVRNSTRAPGEQDKDLNQIADQLDKLASRLRGQ